MSYPIWGWPYLMRRDQAQRRAGRLKPFNSGGLDSFQFECESFVLMRVRIIVAGSVSATVAGLIALSILATPAGPRPPVLTLVRVEPAGIIDDTGAEMWLMTLSVTNSDNRPRRR